MPTITPQAYIWPDQNTTTGRYWNMSIKEEPRFSNSGLMISSETKRRTNAIGVYMAGAGYGLTETYVIAQLYALFNSSNWPSSKTRGNLRAWRICDRGLWRETSAVPAPLSALTFRRARRQLADAVDEPDQSGALSRSGHDEPPSHFAVNLTYRRVNLD